jgi:hypothetical protein
MAGVLAKEIVVYQYAGMPLGNLCLSVHSDSGFRSSGWRSIHLRKFLSHEEVFSKDINVFGGSYCA